MTDTKQGVKYSKQCIKIYYIELPIRIRGSQSEIRLFYFLVGWSGEGIWLHQVQAPSGCRCSCGSVHERSSGLVGQIDRQLLP